MFWLLFAAGLWVMALTVAAVAVTLYDGAIGLSAAVGDSYGHNE